MDIRRISLSALLGLLLAGPALADALYPTKQEMLLLTRRVAALERSTNQPGPVLKADAPSGNVESITNYSTLYFKPRDYAAFRLTNSGTEAHLQVSVNGDFLLSSNVPSAGQMLYASGSSYTSLYWKSSLLGHVTNVDVRASDADLGYVAGGTFVVEWNTNAILNGGMFGGVDVGLLNSNFYLTYTNFLSVSNVVNSNAWITYSNAVANNSNFQSRIADMMVGLLGSGGSYGFFTNEAAYRSDMSNFFFRNYTNIALFTNGSFATYGSFSNIVYPISTNVAGIWLDIGLLNTNFLLISNDFAVTKAYLLGGGVTNQYGTNTWSYDGTETNAALVPALQYNQGVYQTNFMRVNTNTWLTTNLFALLGDMLEIPTNAYVSTNYAVTVREAYDAWTASFLAMDTNYSALPTNLVFSFPGLFSLFNDQTVVPGYEACDNDVRAEVLAILAELGIVVAESYTYVPDKYAYTATNSYAWTTNSVQLYVVPGTNDLPVGSLLMVNAWGGGGNASDGGFRVCGGYAGGFFTNVAPEDYNDLDASHVTNGMVFAVQVGAASGRAAVWRAGTNGHYHTMTNEIVVGGAGGDYALGVGRSGTFIHPGYGGGTNGGSGAGAYYGTLPGGGASQNEGGAAGGAGGSAGVRVWGGRHQGAESDRGGDGYYGGGSKGTSTEASPGGGGSGYVAPTLIDGVCYDIGGRSVPCTAPNTGYYVPSAELGSPGLVTFVRLVVPGQR